MRTLICFAFLTFSTLLSLGTHSSLTAEDVYARYIEAIGGKEKLMSVVSQQASVISYDSTNRVVAKKIEVMDMVTKQWASISCGYNNSVCDIVRLLVTNGKQYIIHGDKTTEGPAPDQIMFLESIFSGLKLVEGSKLMPNEMINNEEAYVIRYISKPLNSFDIEMFDYYSVKTGLFIARKSKMLMNDDGFEDLELPMNFAKFDYHFFSDYREVDGVMLPFTIKSCSDSSAQKSCSTIKYYQVLFNVDIEQFKNVIFKNPKEAIESIPD